MYSSTPHTLRFALFATAAIATLLLSGCSTVSPPEIERTRAVDVDDSHPRAKLVIGSTKLINKVVIVSPKFRRVGALTEASVAVQNMTSNTYNLECRFEWEDDEGFTVEGLSVWQPFTLTPNLVKKFSATGPNPSATRIIFTVRFPHTSGVN